MEGQPIRVLNLERLGLRELVRLEQDGFAVTVPTGSGAHQERLRQMRAREAVERLRVLSDATGQGSHG